MLRFAKGTLRRLLEAGRKKAQARKRLAIRRSCSKAPSEIDGHTVTVIGDAAFESCESLESIIVPSSILSIGMTTSAIR